MSAQQSYAARDRPTLPFGVPVERYDRRTDERSQDRRSEVILFVNFDSTGEFRLRTVGQQQRKYVRAQLDGGRRDHDRRHEHGEHERLFLFGDYRRAEQDSERVRRAHRQRGGDDELKRPHERIGPGLRRLVVGQPARQIGVTGELGELDAVTGDYHDRRAAVQQEIVVFVQ